MIRNSFCFKDSVLCYKYSSNYKVNFKHCILTDNERKEKTLNNNVILFLRKGRLRLTCDIFNKEITSLHCIMLPKGSMVTYKALEASEILFMSFDILQNVCERRILYSLKKVSDRINYDCTPTPIVKPLSDYIDQMVLYLNSGIGCDHLNEIKEMELFLILRGYYTKEEFAYLLYPLCQESSFKSLVLQHYLRVTSVSELARTIGMSRTVFDNTFKEVFGLSPHQWMLKQLAKRVLHKSAEPNITINELISHFKFNSATHFNRFCKQQFNCTPLQLIKKHYSKSL